MKTLKLITDEPLRQVSADIDAARNLSKQILQSLPELNPNLLTLIEEHLAAIVQQWLHSRSAEDIAELNVKDFSVLLKFLLDIAERRSTLESDTKSELHPDQLAAIEATLIGEEA